LILDEIVRWTAKYPFDKDSMEFLRRISLSIEEYTSGEFSYMLDLAYKRAEMDINGEPPLNWDNDYIESIIYYLAMLIVSGTRNNILYRRFSEAEAKRVYKLLQNDKVDNIIRIAKNLGIDCKKYNENKIKISLFHFIKITRSLSSIHWRLYNFKLSKGYVTIDKRRFSRLVSQVVKDNIFDMINRIKEVPMKIKEYSGNLLEKASQYIKQEEAFAEEEILSKKIEDYPPCIKYLLNNVGSGLSHPGRFTLVTFLHSVGYTIDEIVDIFRVTPDYNEKMTKYQVEHILGLRGSRIEYSAPSCKKIRSYGYCLADEICKKYNIKHPVSYMRIQLRRSKKK